MYLELELCEKQRQPLDSAQTHCSSAATAPLLQARARRFDRCDDLIVALEDAVVALPSRSLSMLLYELLDNALKFSPPGTVIKVTSQIAGETLLLSIHDSGQGMTAEQIDRIGALMQFERRKYEQQGLGMGLTIVKKIVELAGGAFSMTSVYQQETTVQLTLPLAR
jgi:signal transduction histidine kinase